eukprot:6317947-Prymnesium_polylepis.1
MVKRGAWADGLTLAREHEHTHAGAHGIRSDVLSGARAVSNKIWDWPFTGEELITQVAPVRAPCRTCSQPPCLVRM